MPSLCTTNSTNHKNLKHDSIAPGVPICHTGAFINPYSFASCGSLGSLRHNLPVGPLHRNVKNRLIVHPTSHCPISYLGFLDPVLDGVKHVLHRNHFVHWLLWNRRTLHGEAMGKPSRERPWRCFWRCTWNHRSKDPGEVTINLFGMCFHWRGFLPTMGILLNSFWLKKWKIIADYDTHCSWFAPACTGITMLRPH